MSAPVLIDYTAFLANVQQEDARMLAIIGSGETVKTTDAVEADTFEARGVRLYNAGCLTRIRRSLEVVGGETWHVFDGRANPTALAYVAQCAMERVMLSREPLPTA